MDVRTTGEKKNQNQFFSGLIHNIRWCSNYFFFSFSKKKKNWAAVSCMSTPKNRRRSFFLNSMSTILCGFTNSTSSLMANFSSREAKKERDKKKKRKAFIFTTLHVQKRNTRCLPKCTRGRNTWEDRRFANDPALLLLVIGEVHAMGSCCCGNWSWKPTVELRWRWVTRRAPTEATYGGGSSFAITTSSSSEEEEEESVETPGTVVFFWACRARMRSLLPERQLGVFRRSDCRMEAAVGGLLSPPPPPDTGLGGIPGPLELFATTRLAEKPPLLLPLLSLSLTGLFGSSKISTCRPVLPTAAESFPLGPTAGAGGGGVGCAGTTRRNCEGLVTPSPLLLPAVGEDAPSQPPAFLTGEADCRAVSSLSGGRSSALVGNRTTSPPPSVKAFDVEEGAVRLIIGEATRGEWASGAGQGPLVNVFSSFRPAGGAAGELGLPRAAVLLGAGAVDFCGWKYCGKRCCITSSALVGWLEAIA